MSAWTDPICPHCEMAIMDDYYRADNGEEWHYECWNQPPVEADQR